MVADLFFGLMKVVMAGVLLATFISLVALLVP